jgi:hypothetical protein
MFQLLVNTSWNGAAFVSLLWLESFGIGTVHTCASSRKDSRVNPVSQNICFMSLYILNDNLMFSVNYM